MSLPASQLPFATCGVCTNPYNSRNHIPKSLRNCAHTVCSACIPKFQRLQCPECRVPIPHRDPAEYPTNIEIIRMNDQLSSLTQTVSSAASSALSPATPAPRPSPAPLPSSNPYGSLSNQRPYLPSPSCSAAPLPNRVSAPSMNFSMEPKFADDMTRELAEKYFLQSSKNCLLRNGSEYADCPISTPSDSFYHNRFFVFTYRHQDSVSHIPLVLSFSEKTDICHLSIAQHEEKLPPYAKGVLQILQDLTIQIPETLASQFRHTFYKQQAAGEKLLGLFDQTAKRLIERAHGMGLYSPPPSPSQPILCVRPQIAKSSSTPLEWYTGSPKLLYASPSLIEKKLKSTDPFQIIFYVDETHSRRLYLSFRLLETGHGSQGDHFAHIPFTFFPATDSNKGLLIPGQQNEDDSWTFLTDSRGNLLPPLELPAVEEANFPAFLRDAAVRPYLEKTVKLATGSGFKTDYQAQWLGDQEVLRADFGTTVDQTRYAVAQALKNRPPRTFVFYRIEEIETMGMSHTSPNKFTAINFGFSFVDVLGEIQHGFLSVDKVYKKCFLTGPSRYPSCLAEGSPYTEISIDSIAYPESNDFMTMSEFLISNGLVQRFVEKRFKGTIDNLYNCSFPKERALLKVDTSVPSSPSFSRDPGKLVFYTPTVEERSAEPPIETPVPKNLKVRSDAGFIRYPNVSDYLREEGYCVIGAAQSKYVPCDLLVPEEYRPFFSKWNLFTFAYRKDNKIYGVPTILAFSADNKARLFVAKYGAPTATHPKGTLKIPVHLPPRDSFVEKQQHYEKTPEEYLENAITHLTTYERGRFLALLKSGIQNQCNDFLSHACFREEGTGFNWPSPRCLSSTQAGIDDAISQAPYHTLFLWKEEQGPLFHLTYRRLNGERVQIDLERQAATSETRTIYIDRNRNQPHTTIVERPESTQLRRVTVANTSQTCPSVSLPLLPPIVLGSDLSAEHSLVFEQILFSVTQMKLKGSSLPDPVSPDSEYVREPIQFPLLVRKPTRPLRERELESWQQKVDNTFEGASSRSLASSSSGGYAGASAFNPPAGPSYALSGGHLEPQQAQAESASLSSVGYAGASAFNLPAGPSYALSGGHLEPQQAQAESASLSSVGYAGASAFNPPAGPSYAVSANQSSFNSPAPPVHVPSASQGPHFHREDYGNYGFFRNQALQQGLAAEADSLSSGGYAGGSSFDLPAPASSMQIDPPEEEKQATSGGYNPLSFLEAQHTEPSYQTFRLQDAPVKPDSILNQRTIQGSQEKPITGEMMKQLLQGRPPASFIVATTTKRPKKGGKPWSFYRRVGFINKQGQFKEFFLEFDSPQNTINFYKHQSAGDFLSPIKEDQSMHNVIASYDRALQSPKEQLDEFMKYSDKDFFLMRFAIIVNLFWDDN